jgi:serine/threonine protein kinase
MVEAAITFGTAEVQYKLGEMIGEGGQGQVFMCTRLTDNEQVIAKIIKSDGPMPELA